MIDPFNGQSLSREELDERLQPLPAQHGLLGDDEVPLGLFLQAAPPREVVARLLRNLKEIHRSAGDWSAWPPCCAVSSSCCPSDWDERRDRGLVLAELGRPCAGGRGTGGVPGAPADGRRRRGLRRQLAAWRRLQ